MAKRDTGVKKRTGVRSHKTKKRLEAKKVMLETKIAKNRRKTKKKSK